MSVQDGGPAFPHEEVRERLQGLPTTWTNHKGMSLRDWFAGQALHACIIHDISTPNADVAVWSYRVADAMLAERNRG
jgi:hypothetical protein